jgi:uncharacterized membrane-anchored protein
MTTRPSGDEPVRGATVIASLSNGHPWTRSLRHKVPDVSLPFWVLTILSAIVGATVADLLSAGLGLSLGLGMSATTAIMGLVAATSLLWQLSTGHYLSGSYWLAVVSVSVLGTLVSDDLVDNLGLARWAATGVFCATLLAAFLGWYCTEHTVSMHAVRTRRGEVWHWLVVVSAFSLGASVGDLVSGTLTWGYAVAGLAFGAVLAMIACAHHWMRLNAVASFWAAYVVTRSVGSSVGDFLTATPGNGGLGLGTNATSAVFLLAILVTFGFSSQKARRAGRKQSGAGQVSGPTVTP